MWVPLTRILYSTAVLQTDPAVTPILPQGAWGIVAQLGVGGALAVIIVFIVLYFQAKREESGKGYARSGEVKEINDKLDEFMLQMSKLNQAMVGYDGHGGIIWEIEDCKEWRKAYERERRGN